MLPSQGTARRLRTFFLLETQDVGILGFGKKTTFIVAVSFEGGGRMRLNANRMQRPQIKRNAAAHAQTICWLELSEDGRCLDQGTGPSAARLGKNGEADRLLRDVLVSSALRSVTEDLKEGREHASKWYKKPN